MVRLGNIAKVLNLVLNGYSLKFKGSENLQHSLDGFKPCFKWLLPKIAENPSKNIEIKINLSFKPCFKWLLPKIHH